MSLSDIVSVSVTRETAKLTRAGFSRAMILGVLPAGAEAAFGSDQWKDYSSLSELIADGFQTTDTIYKAAAALIGQNPRVRDFRVGAGSDRVAMVVTYTPTVQNSADYEVTIDGVTYNPANSDSDATAAEIVTLLKDAINADPACPVTASGTDTLILTADNAGAGFTYSATANLTAAVTTPNVGPAEDVLDMVDQPDGDNFYGLILADRNDEVAWWVASQLESIGKLFAFVTSDSGVTDDAYSSTTPTDVPSRLKAAGIENTLAIFHDDLAEYPDAAWMGMQFTRTPGDSTWKFKSPKLITPIALSTSQRNNLKAKSANWYETVAGISIMAEGTVCSGEFIDIIHGTAWLRQRMAEDVFAALAQAAKIPYTSAGLQMVRAAMLPSLQAAENVGLLAAEPKFAISMPEIGDVSSDDKASRQLNGVTFTATYAGAVHAVAIAGTVSV